MALPNIHQKLFAENGSDKLLREDIIPWSESPYASVPIVSKHFATASAISSGEAVSTQGCGYRPGTGSLMVFMDGLCLDEGVHYAEAESGEEVTLLFDCQAGVTFEFVAHDGYEYEYEEPFHGLKYTVAPTSTSELSYCPLDPSRLTSGSISIDWGDGSTSVLEAGSSTDCPTHAYATSDGTRYQVTLEADDSVWACVTAMFFGTSTTVSLNAGPEDDVQTLAVDQTGSRVRYLVSVDSPLPYMGFTTGAYMFYNNRLLESVPSDLFQNQASDITSFRYCFYHCDSLASLPTGLFDNCTAVADFSYCFRNCESLTSLPTGLFGCPSATDFSYCFSNCTSLTSLPTGLFGNCTAVTTFSYCFYYTALTEIPPDLFSNCPDVTNLSRCLDTTGDTLSFELDLTNVNKVTNVSYFASSSSSGLEHIVKVTSGSTTESTFNKSSNANVTVEAV